MHKVHVTVYYSQSLDAVFAAIADHRKFLSGGGLVCRIMKAGAPEKNGKGTVRMVRANKRTLIEEITAFEVNKGYDYLIKEVKPPAPLQHHHGWLEFNEIDDQVRVDWHSHFTITTPVIGHFIGWLAKRQLEKVFLQRLNYVKKNL